MTMEIITDTQSLASASATLSKSRFVTVDTEFLRDATYWPKLCLIQIAGENDAFIVDPLAKGIDLAPFSELMSDPDVLKVFHAARQDLEIFVHQLGVMPAPLFDTQIAAMVCGFGDQVGYETLVREVAGEQVDKSSRFTDWSKRPLSEKQLSYAISDVTHLRPVYEKLADDLAASGREAWLAEEMAAIGDPATYNLDPSQSWQRLKSRFRGRRGLAVLQAVAAWREVQAQERNLPRQRVLKDDALYEIATQMPKSSNALDEMRAVPKGFIRSRHGETLWPVIERALALPDDELPVPEKTVALPPGIGPLVDLLKVLLKHCCEQENVAQKLVANVSDLELIAASDEADVAALKGWRREIFGADALALKHGKLALAAKGRSTRLIRLKD